MTDKLREAAQEDIRCECCGYMTHHREHLGCIRADMSQQDAQAELPIIRQNKLLADALASCILASGIVRTDIDGLTGPQLLLFAEDLREMLETKKAQQDEQVVSQGWREFLKEIEWANSDYNAAGDAEPYCVCCDAWQSQGHKPDCKFIAMLNASPTPPAQRVMLTDDEIEDLARGKSGHSDFARAVIEAYERKNGLKP